MHMFLRMSKCGNPVCRGSYRMAMLFCSRVPSSSTAPAAPPAWLLPFLRLGGICRTGRIRRAALVYRKMPGRDAAVQVGYVRQLDVRWYAVLHSLQDYKSICLMLANRLALSKPSI